MVGRDGLARARSRAAPRPPSPPRPRSTPCAGRRRTPPPAGPRASRKSGSPYAVAMTDATPRCSVTVLAVVAGAGERLERLVVRVLDERLLTGPLGVAGDVADRAPVPGPLAVRVGDDEVGTVGQQPGADAAGSLRERRGVQDERLPVDDTRRRGVDEALAVARDDDGLARRPPCARSLGVARRRTPGPSADRRAFAGIPSSIASSHRLLGRRLVAACAVRSRSGRRAPGGDVGQRREQQAWPRGAVALVLRGRSARRRHRPRTSARSGRPPRARAMPSWTRRSSASSRSADACEPNGISSRSTDGRLIRPGQDRVDGVAPAVRREVGAGQLEHARASPLRVEVVRGVVPVRGDVLGPLQVLRDVVGPPRGRKVGDRSTPTTTAALRPAAPTRDAALSAVTPAPEQDRDPEHDQRDRSRRAAQREPDRRALGEGLEQRARGTTGRRMDRARPRSRVPTGRASTK